VNGAPSTVQYCTVLLSPWLPQLPFRRGSGRQKPEPALEGATSGSEGDAQEMMPGMAGRGGGKRQNPLGIAVMALPALPVERTVLYHPQWNLQYCTTLNGTYSTVPLSVELTVLSVDAPNRRQGAHGLQAHERCKPRGFSLWHSCTVRLYGRQTHVL